MKNVHTFKFMVISYSGASFITYMDRMKKKYIVLFTFEERELTFLNFGCGRKLFVMVIVIVIRTTMIMIIIVFSRNFLYYYYIIISIIIYCHYYYILTMSVKYFVIWIL